MTRQDKIIYIAESVVKDAGAAIITVRTKKMYGRNHIEEFSASELEDCYSLVYIFNNPFKK